MKIFLPLPPSPPPPPLFFERANHLVLKGTNPKRRGRWRFLHSKSSENETCGHSVCSDCLRHPSKKSCLCVTAKSLKNCGSCGLTLYVSEDKAAKSCDLCKILTCEYCQALYSVGCDCHANGKRQEKVFLTILFRHDFEVEHRTTSARLVGEGMKWPLLQALREEYGEERTIQIELEADGLLLENHRSLASYGLRGRKQLLARVEFLNNG